jgi:hypothetical protein
VLAISAFLLGMGEEVYKGEAFPVADRVTATSQGGEIKHAKQPTL